MVRCASLFSQLVALFSRGKFYQLVIEHGAERYSKGYSSWDHFVAMLFCQLAQAKSLREICWRPGLHDWKTKAFGNERRTEEIYSILCQCSPTIEDVP